MGLPLELVKYNVEDGKFQVGQAAVEKLMKVRLAANRQLEEEESGCFSHEKQQQHLGSVLTSRFLRWDRCMPRLELLPCVGGRGRERATFSTDC